MAVSTHLLPDAEEIGSAVAELVLDRYRSRAPGRMFLLGCPGGRSLESTYVQLGRRVVQGAVDLSDLVIVMMDEYVVADGKGWRSVEDSVPHSCRRFGREVILANLNADRPVPGRIPPEHLWLPDPVDPEAYESRLEAAGGVDLFLLASGAGDGHVAFNPPGTDADARTRVVALPDSTRLDNLATFPSFGNRLDAVPAFGVTVGVGTIRDRSAEVVMVVHGQDKARAARHLSGADRYDPDWPATVFVECRRPSLFLDRAAAGAPPRTAGQGQS